MNTLHGLLAHHAGEHPDRLAIIESDTGAEYSYAEFEAITKAVALELLELGFEKGDFLATSLPMLAEHVFVEYACFRIGVVFAPLDLRLKAPDVIGSLERIRAKGYVFLGRTEFADFAALGEAVRKACPFVESFLQFVPREAVVEGATSMLDLMSRARARSADPAGDDWDRIEELGSDVSAEDGALVIYTTGSTGYPKPALLSHRNILAQDEALVEAFGMDGSARMLVHLPPSHVGCQTEQLMATFFGGGTAVLMHVFDAERTLRVIEDHRVTVLGQIPAMFEMQWRLPGYDAADLSSLELVIFAGQQVSHAFAERLTAAFGRVATGYGLTECAGFVTYTQPSSQPSDLAEKVGHDTPLSPVTIRSPLTAEGRAGPILPDGEEGEICVSGPQVFIAYVNDEDAYRRTVTRDGVCYTGDLGERTADGIRFAGRAKLVIKPKGYQVHPAQVEDWFAGMADRIARCAALGAPHEIFTEGIVLFVEKQPGTTIGIDELEERAAGIAAYMRPSHYILLEPGELPLNRTAKTDYVTLAGLALAEIENLRATGGWDGA